MPDSLPGMRRRGKPAYHRVVKDEARFLQVFNTVEQHIERRYGIPVIISDVPNPFTGDLDGSEIRVDHDLDAEEAAFILIHLFGHTVQWNLSARAREIGTVIQQNPTDELLQELEDYERTACRYSLALFHEAGVHDLDQWLSDFAACDFAYLHHFYKTGEKLPFKSFWIDGKQSLPPLAIPPFTPQRWVSRWDGVVV
jgi:hypothetical protein